MSSAEDAEFISLRISEHDPRLITGLSDVGVSCTEGQQPINLSALINRAEVEVQPILGCLFIWCQSDHTTVVAPPTTTTARHKVVPRHRARSALASIAVGRTACGTRRAFVRGEAGATR